MEAKKNQLEQVRVRPATEADAPFIFNSWLRSYRPSIGTRNVESPVFFAQHHKLIEGLFQRAEVLIACNNADVAQIYGYIVSERIEGILVIHYAYVKEIYRKQFGLARQLAEAAGFNGTEPIIYTHHTFGVEPIKTKHVLVYNPYLAYYGYDLGTKTGKDVSLKATDEAT